MPLSYRSSRVSPYWGAQTAPRRIIAFGFSNDLVSYTPQRLTQSPSPVATSDAASTAHHDFRVGPNMPNAGSSRAWRFRLSFPKNPSHAFSEPFPLCGCPFVVVMPSANMGKLDHPAPVRRMHRPRIRCILRYRETWSYQHFVESRRPRILQRRERPCPRRRERGGYGKFTSSLNCTRPNTAFRPCAEFSMSLPAAIASGSSNRYPAARWRTDGSCALFASPLSPATVFTGLRVYFSIYERLARRAASTASPA